MKGNKSNVQEVTGTGMNVTQNSNNDKIPKSIEHYVGNSYLSEISKKSNEDSNSDVRVTR
jgi:hypothetical protein